MSTGGVHDCSETGSVSCFVGEAPQSLVHHPGPPLQKRAEPGFPFRRVHGHLVPV